MAQPPAIVERIRSTFLAPIERDITSSLPPGVSLQRFQAAFITAAQTNPDIAKCSMDSVRNALMKCAADGLVPDGRMAAIVAYGNVAQYMPMVQGIISRARDLGDSFSITAECVYEKDELIVNRADLNNTMHKTPPLGHPRGEIVGAYVIFRDKDGRVIHREIMDRDEVEKTRGVSRAKNSPAWANWFGEMARKTVIRRGSKYVPMSDALRKIIEREDEHVVLDLPATEQSQGYNPLVTPQQDQATETETLPADVFVQYSIKLREAKAEGDLPKLAQAFWSASGGWPPKAEADAKMGQKIYDAVVGHFANKTTLVALDKELQGILKSS